MLGNYPNDSDGDALRRVVNDGSDMSKPMFIDFQVAVPDEAAANVLAKSRIEAWLSCQCLQ
jgi:regulator of ribonuclease activity B